MATPSWIGGRSVNGLSLPLGRGRVGVRVDRGPATPRNHRFSTGMRNADYPGRTFARLPVRLQRAVLMVDAGSSRKAILAQLSRFRSAG